MKYSRMSRWADRRAEMKKEAEKDKVKIEFYDKLIVTDDLKEICEVANETRN